jgi:hypothetical protein
MPRGPTSDTLTVAPDGVLHAGYVVMDWVGDGDESWYGSARTVVVYRASSDRGQTWGPARTVSRPSEAVVVYDPMVAVDGGTVYVAYVAGAAPDAPRTAAWDVVLATSVDGGATWVYRRVNDDPSGCASHAMPRLAVDPVRHVVHVTWYENRFGDGALAYAACPRDATQPCGRNEQVSDAPFAMVTGSLANSGTPGFVHGLARDATGELWAAWSDPRASVSAVYFARGRPR